MSTNPNHFAQRRSRVLDDLGPDVMILPAAPTLYRAGDSEFPYRPDSELFYLTGLREPEGVLVLRGFADEDREVLFVRDRDRKVEQWTGLRLGPEGAARSLGIQDARSVSKLEDDLPALLRGARRMHFRIGADSWIEPMIVEALREARARGARDGRGPRGVIDPGGILDELRLRKDAVEVAAVREAVRASVAGFDVAFDRLQPGAGEWEVEAALTGAFRREGASGPAFAPIVASGANACVLHYIENSRRIGPDELVLIDAGAEVSMYAGDITRTVPAGGRFTSEQRTLYEIVDAARAAAIDIIAPGVKVSRIHEIAVRLLVEGLIDVGLLVGDPEELVEAETYRAYFPHQTSHWLGLNTHDPGDYARGGESRLLESGMVLTVEPGLYVPTPDFFGPEDFPAENGGPEGLPDPGPFAGIGIRIEDDILVTESGHEVLTAGLPTAPTALEARIQEVKA